MNTSNRLLSDIVAYRTYAKFLSHLGRRESIEETINRNMTMHLDRFPKLSSQIVKAYQRVHNLQVMPSMRALQFSGDAILRNSVRQYNCSFANLDHPRVFSEALYLLLSGVGFGFSVQKQHVNQLPPLKLPREKAKFVVPDSIMGWAIALENLMSAYFYGSVLPEFDFTSIRPKGSYLVTTGAKAPGPEPLRKMLNQVEDILKASIGKKLTTLQCHDLMCIISDAVLAGGIRRAALISLFDRDDEAMLKCKHGEWWNSAPWRARANNSAVLPRSEVSEEEFRHIFKMCQNSGSGEPGFYWTNDTSWGANPCFTADTKLLTAEGYKTIGSLKDTSFKIINHRGETHQGKVWSNGFKPVVEIKNSLGETVRCTPDHRFMLTDTEECVAEKLKGKRLMPFLDVRNTNDHYTKLGFIQGDGATSRLISTTHKGLELNIGMKDQEIGLLFDIETRPEKRTYYVTGFNDELRELGFDSNTLPTRKLPTTFVSWSETNKLSFLRGLYSANGSVISNHRVSFKTTCEELSLELVETLKEFGVSSYITENKAKDVKFTNGTYECKHSYDVNITQYNSIKLFAKLIGFVHEYKTKALKDLLINRSPTITSVRVLEQEEEVFDFSINDDTHWGVVGEGYIAHNCVEIALQSNQFCNLTTINQTGIKSKRDFMNRVHAATLIGTLQASYTDFDYLRPVWKNTTESEALLGVSFTGIADGYGNEILSAETLIEGAKEVVELNKKYAKMLGINPAARTTAIKPEGTSSCVLGSSSGVHARHSEYYLRRIRMNANDSLAVYLQSVIPDLVEPDSFSAGGVVVTIPQESPKGSITRDMETAKTLLDRSLFYHKNWIKPGHTTGKNTHNVSVTISVKDNEWDSLCDEMWKKRNSYSGISLLPYDGGTYKQAPFESCSKEEYEQKLSLVKEIDLRKVVEVEDTTNRIEQVACSGGVCEIV